MVEAPMRLRKEWMLACVALAGCQDVIDLDPIDRRAPVEASVRPPPISGGTLVVTSDGVAVAADPDRDLVHVVDLVEKRVRHTIALEAGDEPGRVVQGSGSLVHVILRGAGGLATVDVAEGSVLSRQQLCSEPRGLAFDSEVAALHVACADGTLVSLDEASGAELERKQLEPDLRDVVLVDGQRYVSQLRSATLLADDGTRLAAADPGSDFAATVAWRTFVGADGQLWMMHQLASTNPVPTEPPPSEDGGGDDGGGGGDLPYGGGNFCQLGIAGAALTNFTAGQPTTQPLPGAPLTVDAAVSPDGHWMALAMPGAEEGRTTLGLVPPGEFCAFSDFLTEESEEQVVAVAFTPNGTLVAQSREPNRLLIQYDLPFGDVTRIELGGERRYDTGHEIFHRRTESGLSCASCHPEGTDDGHVWVFEGLGKRRTQALDIGLADTAPFHWDGEMHDLDVLMEEVLSHRMGGKRQSGPRGESFTRWLFEQQRPAAGVGPRRDDPTLVEQGEALFVAYDCGQCHTGDALGGTMTAPIRNVELQVPSLRRVSLHPPFMHDGRSRTLDQAVRDMIETTTQAAYDEADVAALTAYMRTL
jgi:mono/diheme cytochrome c family protein